MSAAAVTHSAAYAVLKCASDSSVSVSSQKWFVLLPALDPHVLYMEQM